MLLRIIGTITFLRSAKINTINKGTEVRKKISRTAGDWAGQLSDLFKNAKEEVANLKNKGAKAAGDVASKYTNATENFS